MKKQNLSSMFVSACIAVFLFFGFTPSVSAQYCIPQGDCATYDDMINDFYTTGGIRNITNMNSGCSPNAYGDFTATDTLEVAPGSSFTFHVQTSPISDPQGFVIWIDWNQNQNFTDPGDMVWTSGTTGTQLFTGTIQVPASATPGATRLRVRCDYYGPPQDPCAMQLDGETEDYTIVITSGVTCLQPDNLSAYNITDTLAYLNWTENNTASQWQIEYGADGFTPGTGTLIDVSSKPYILGGLTPYTPYEYHVRSICAAGDTSSWSATQQFTTLPTCVAPGGTYEDQITHSSARAFWTEMNNASQWVLEYGPEGFLQGNGTLISTGNNPHTFQNLNPATTYDYYVQSVCAVDDTSFWSSKSSFTTQYDLGCGADPQQTHFRENWSGGQGYWTGDVGFANGEWRFETGSTGTMFTGPAGPKDGSQYIYYEASGAGSPGSATMVSPAIDLTTANISTFLTFWMHAYGNDIPGATLNIGVGTNAAGPFTNQYSQTFSSQLQSNENDPYIQDTVNLSSYAGQTIYLEIEYINPNSYASDLALDLIEVISCLDCSNPPVPDLGTDTLRLCADQPAVLDAGSFHSYQWSTGQTSQTITVDTSGTGPGYHTFQITVTDSLGCAAKDSIVVGWGQYPPAYMVSATGDTLIKEPIPHQVLDTLQMTFYGPPGFYQYYWNTGDTTPYTTISITAGTIQPPYKTVAVAVTNKYGCTSYSDTVELHFNFIDFVGPGISKPATGLEVYPNPSDGTFKVALHEQHNENITLEIIAANGTLTHKEVLNDTQLPRKYHMNHLKPGVYFVRVTGEKGISVERIVVR